VLDLGAGTGKLTRMLAASGPRLLALEPVQGMWRVLAEVLPEARVVAARAEALPFADGSVDAATAAQAFHWFDAAAAIAELHRVLRPGARIGLVWNVRDEATPWVAGLTRIMDPHRGDAPAVRRMAWRAAFDRTDAFTQLELTTFRHEHRLTVGGVLDRVLSVSFIAALPEGGRAEVERQVRELLATDPETAGRDEVVMPYRTDVWTAERNE